VPGRTFSVSPLQPSASAKQSESRLRHRHAHAIAVLLSAVGIYGVLAYAIGQRTREFGVRTALGARSRDVRAMVLRQGLRLTTIGIGIGLTSAIALTRYMEGMLYEVTPLDPLTYVGVVALFAAVASIASYLPARRATRIDPMTALRYE
jgi:putative ABC transport system permease protein